MQLKDLSNCNHKCAKLYRKARGRGISYHQFKGQLKIRYGVESSGDLTLNQYREALTLLNYLPIDRNTEREIIQTQKQWYEEHRVISDEEYASL
jgi:hypothetical protein